MNNASTYRLPRREFLTGLAAATVATALSTPSFGQTEPAKKRKMTMDLQCGSIGVSANQPESIELAHRFGFESVGADGGYLASLPEDKLTALLGDLKAKGLVWGGAGLPTDFRGSDTAFKQGLDRLPPFAAGLRRAGVSRMGTWISPGHGSLTYLKNFKQHATRLRAIGQVLKDHGLRFGLEYVGPKTSWVNSRYPFVHCMAEMKDLLGEIGLDNVGFILDSWHWYTSGETAADLLSLRGEQVVGVDLNDAPSGIAVNQQVDSRRELPTATGVIDLAIFLNSLNQIGYDGPVRVEPFNKALSAMKKDEACAAVAEALKKAFSLIRT